MKIFGYILVFAFLFMSVPISAETCSEESGMQCAEMSNTGNDTSKTSGADYCLCIFHHMQFNTAIRDLSPLELKFSSVKFILPQDNILSSLEASVLLQPPALA